MTKKSDSTGKKQDSPARAEATGRGAFSELFWTLFWAVIIATALRTVFYQPFHIPSQSMMPTLLVGDYLLVSKFSYGYSQYSIPFSPPLFEGRIMADMPERGDVVVFKRPFDNKTDYIKRVIGMPGDRVQVRSGQIFINNTAVSRERVEDFTFEESPHANCRGWPTYRHTLADGTVECRYPQFRETLPNGRSYTTLDLTPQSRADNTIVFTVPEGHYFVMGDNRDNSQDSRLPREVGVGYVPFENLVGRAEVIFFSTDGSSGWLKVWRWFSAMRFDRFFDGLRPDEA